MPSARPLEAAVLERLLRGGFKSRNLLDDALTIALVETGVPFWALDSDAVEGELGVRVAGADETLGRGPQALPVPAGRLVVADERSPAGRAVRGGGRRARRHARIPGT